MPPIRKKAKLETMRCPNNPVSFEQFKKLIENLPDISFEVQRDGVAGKGVVTLDECAFWYYEAFYRNPEVRHKYPYKLRACPMRIRDKLLSMPKSDPVGESSTEHQIGKGVMVKVARMGTFIFPVTFFAFKSYVNVDKVLRMMGTTNEERKAMLADENQCEIILKKFYNSFYMFPDRQSADIFKDVSLQFLEVLLKHGEPHDELAKKSVEKHAAGKKRQSAVVSFEMFEKYLENMFDIVWQLKLHDRDYAALDFEKCARALYLAFYLKPEIRNRYTFKWRPCSLAIQKRLLNIPDEESAEELRKSFPQLVSDSPNEEEETIEVDTESPVNVIEEPISVGEVPRRSLENNNNNSFEKQLNQPAKENAPPKGDPSFEELLKLILEESSEELQEQLFQTDVEVDIGKSGRFMFPVSFDTFRRCINYAEIIRPILTLALTDKSQLEDLIPHPHNPICEKIFLRYYRSFYIFPDTRQKCEYRFSCRNNQVLKKLTEYAKPLNESALKTMNEPKTKCQEATNAVPAGQSKNNRTEEADIATVLALEGHQNMENKENTKHKEIKENIKNGLKEKANKLQNLPVTFHVFKRYVTNFNKILQQMKLCDEYKDKSDSECAEEYYNGFYTSPEMRNKFECIMRPCPAKMRDVLLSYAKQPVSLDSSKESDCVCSSDVLPTATNVANLSEESKGILVRESKVEKTHDKHVSFIVFKRYISNLKEIVQQMLLCDEFRGKSEEECARDYYTGFYSSQEVRDRFPYQLKPCPAKMRNKLISFPTKVQHMDMDPIPEKLTENIPIQIDEVEVNSSKIPVQTEECLPGLATDFRQRHPYRKADKELVQKSEEYAVPLNDIARKTMSDQTHGAASQNERNECQGRMVPRASKDEILITILGIQYRFPVSFQTFQKYINYEELKEGLATGGDLKKKSPEELKNILKDEKSCLRLLRSYYHSFYTMKNIRNKLKYNFNAAPPELSDKLLEWAKPIDESTEPAQTLSLTQPPIQPKPGNPSAPDIGPVQHEEDASSKKLSALCEPICRSSEKTKENNLATETDEVKVDSSKTPVQTEEFLPQNQTSNNSVAAIGQKSGNTSSNISQVRTIKTLRSGATFEYPVSLETFKRHINYDEIVKSLLEEDAQNETERSNRGKRLFRNFFCSFYVHKDLRQRHPYRFQKADKELLNKLEEYAVPLNDIARKIMSDQTHGPASQNERNEDEGSNDETLVTILGRGYRFPVSFKTFHKYINYEELKEGLATGGDLKKKSPEELKNILEDEKSCLRLLRSYYYSFYTMKKIRNKLKYNFNAAPPELADKLLEWAKPIDESTEPAKSLSQTLPKVQTKQGSPNAATHRPTEAPVTLNVFLNYMLLEDVVARMQQEPEYSTMTEDECKFQYYHSFYSDVSIRDKYPFKLKPCSVEIRERLLMLSPHSDHTYQLRYRDLDDLNASRERELAGHRSLHLYIDTNTSVGEERAFLERVILDSTPTEENETVSRREETTTREETAASEKDPATRKDDTSTTEKDNEMIAETTREEAAAREPTTSEGKKTTSEETKTTRKSQAVPDKVIENNSPKENESQSSKLESVSEKISKTSKNNYRENDKTKHPESSSDLPSPASTTNIEVTKTPEEKQNKEDTTSQDGTGTRNSTAALNVSHRQTERQIILDQAKEMFFAESSQDHNMAYLICTSQGLKRAIWRILYQLTLEEFKTYTSIHNGEDLYKTDKELEPYYQHIVDMGNWPINLYVRLPLLRQLLHSKGVDLGRLDLGQLSPKILHWREADEHTNFDQIVERQFKDRTGEEIDSVEQWFEEREQFYAACWLHDQWIYEVPIITNDALHDESYIKDLPLPDLNGVVLKSLPLARSEDVSSQTEIISIASSSDEVPDSQSCPPTQLSTISNIVDITTMDMQSSSALHDESCIEDRPLTDPNGIVFSSESLSYVEREDGRSQTENISQGSSSDMVPDSQSCPPTQLSHTSNFVDIASVDIQSQVPESPLDPLATQAKTMRSVKQEPIKFLNNLRGVCNTNGCEWEHIGSEEQIVNLDSSQDEGPSLSCFAIQKPSEAISPYQSLDSLLTATMFEESFIVGAEEVQSKESDNIGGLSEHEEASSPKIDVLNVSQQPEEPAVPEVNVIQQAEEPAVERAACTKVSEVNLIQSQAVTLPKLPETRKKKIPASNAVPSKRARLVNDKVPQLRHEFRPLPLGACVRVETDVLGTDTTSTETPQIIPTPQPENVPSNMTPSQEFAQDNTLLESTQLAALLDALPPSLTVRKVNEKEQVNENLPKVTVPEPTLWQIGIFRKLERYHFFAPLTVQHIIKHRIEGCMAGVTYQSALLKIDGKLSHVQGPLLNVLFPHLSPRLRFDLEQVLRDLPEFVYSCRWRRVQTDSTEDLRKRVLFAFMDLAPGFGQFRLQFENASREWVRCSEIGRWNPAESSAPRPGSLETVISPGILDKMRELKEMC